MLPNNLTTFTESFRQVLHIHAIKFQALNFVYESVPFHKCD